MRCFLCRDDLGNNWKSFPMDARPNVVVEYICISCSALLERYRAFLRSLDPCQYPVSPVESPAAE